MTRDEIDIFWQRAMDQSVSAGEMFTRHRFAALVAEAERARADAMAATIQALRQIVTTDHESKSAFVARVNAVLSKCPDTRVLHAVEAEREACAKILEDQVRLFQFPGRGIVAQHVENVLLLQAEYIRARGQQ